MQNIHNEVEHGQEIDSAVDFPEKKFFVWTPGNVSFSFLMLT